MFYLMQVLCHILFAQNSTSLQVQSYQNQINTKSKEGLIKLFSPDAKYGLYENGLISLLAKQLMAAFTCSLCIIV